MKCLEIENVVSHAKYIVFFYLRWPSSRYCSGVLVQTENEPGLWQIDVDEVAFGVLMHF